MNLEQYETNAGDNNLDFEFYSDGPQGKIKKVVRFSKVESKKGTFYNLGFGDWNAAEERIDDFVVTDNKDAEKVLATVASLVLQFTDHYPDSIVYAEGSSPARTRRYQMGLNKYWDQIEPLFQVFGLIKGQGFTELKRGVNYSASVVRRKKQ